MYSITNINKHNKRSRSCPNPYLNHFDNLFIKTIHLALQGQKVSIIHRTPNNSNLSSSLIELKSSSPQIKDTKKDPLPILPHNCNSSPNTITINTGNGDGQGSEDEESFHIVYNDMTDVGFHLTQHNNDNSHENNRTPSGTLSSLEEEKEKEPEPESVEEVDGYFNLCDHEPNHEPNHVHNHEHNHEHGNGANIEGLISEEKRGEGKEGKERVDNTKGDERK